MEFSLIPRPSLPPVFDDLQYAKMEGEVLPLFLHTASDQKLEVGNAWERGNIQYFEGILNGRFSRLTRMVWFGGD